jgi:hypothetical protein
MADKSNKLLKALPTKAIQPPSRLEDYKIALFGTKGIGKTTLANKFEGAFTLICEAPRRNLSIYGYPNYANGDPPLDYETAARVVELFLESDYQTLVVDTGDRLYELCQRQVREEYGVSHEGEIDYGKGWDKPRELFEAMLNQVAFSGKGMVVVSHVVSKDRVNYLAEDKSEEVRPSLDKRGWAWVQTAADIVLCYDFHGADRVLIVRGNERVMARCGLEDRFIATDGKPLNAILMPNDPAVGVEMLYKAFDNELPDYYREKARIEQAKKAKSIETIKARAGGKPGTKPAINIGNKPNKPNPTGAKPSPTKKPTK